MRRTTQGLILALLVAAPGFAAAQDDAVAEYDAVLRRITGLEQYNALLERQIATQERQITELQAAIGQVPDLERQVPPLLVRMVEGLEQFISLDIPFLLDERNERLANLQTLVEDANVNDVEKFRRVLEAWEIENEYGRDVSAYEGTVNINGDDIPVDFLRIGRIALLYQTQDLEQVGAWDSRVGSFVALGTEHRNSIRQAIRMARNTVAPDLVLVPMVPPQDE
jgi:hypothetical protein